MPPRKARPAPDPFPRLDAERLDLSVYYDGKGFYLASRTRDDPGLDFRGRGLSVDQALARHLAVPVWMGNDCLSSLRLARGALSSEERDGWLARVVGRLRLDEGLLGICSEVPIEVPPGEYLVEVGFHLPYALLCDFFVEARTIFDEPVGAWFRRTRPAEPMPPWLAEWLIATPADDPEHETEWKRKRKPRPRERWIDLVVRLADPSESLPLTPVERGMPQMEVRKPPACPLGLAAIDPVALPD
jgi:hypothetical protein